MNLLTSEHFKRFTGESVSRLELIITAPARVVSRNFEYFLFDKKVIELLFAS